MKYILLTALAFMLGNSVTAALNKDNVAKELNDSMYKAFGGAQPDLGKLDMNLINKFTAAIANVETYVKENYKNVIGIKDSDLEKAATAVVKAGKNIVAVIPTIVNPRTESGVNNAVAMLKTQKTDLNNVEISLKKAGFRLSNKINAYAVLDATIRNLQALINKSVAYADIQIEELKTGVPAKGPKKPVPPLPIMPATLPATSP